MIPGVKPTQDTYGNIPLQSLQYRRSYGRRHHQCQLWRGCRECTPPSIISLTKEASEKKERRSFLKRKPFSGDETLSVLASEWSALLKAGLTITATLALLEEQAKKHEKPILSRARETVMEGRTLWETLDESGAFPRFFSALIQVG